MSFYTVIYISKYWGLSLFIEFSYVLTLYGSDGLTWIYFAPNPTISCFEYISRLVCLLFPVDTNVIMTSFSVVPKCPCYEFNFKRTEENAKLMMTTVV